jgi:hypothetical protein
MVQFSMILDFLDALAGAVALACWWCTWVQPAKQQSCPRSTERAEIVCEARAPVTTATVPISSSQRTGTSNARAPA